MWKYQTPLRYINAELHSSWHIAWACTAIVVGIVMIQVVPQGIFSSIAWLLTGTSLILTALWQKRAAWIILAICGGLLMGLWRGSYAAEDLGLYQPYFGKKVTIAGIVSEDTETNERGQLVLRIKTHSINGKKMNGTIWMTATDKRMIQRSDVIQANTVLRPGFGSFAATAYRAEISSVARPQPGDIALTVRDAFAQGVRQNIPEPQSSLGLGYLVGQRRGLPEKLDTALKAAGLTHIVVASGYNLTILVRLARRLFEKISKYISFISASTMIISFIAITGMSPSMSRAGLVAGLSLMAWYYGRSFHPLVLLPLAMAITVLIQPSYAWGDVGWQLSFAAFAGVMILAPLMQAYFFGDKPERPIRRIVIETISAQIATLPILLVAFGQFSAVAPIANLLILPLVPLAMLLTFIAGLGGLLLGSTAVLLAFPAQVLLTYMTETAMYIGKISWAIQEMSVSVIVAMLMYLVIICACIYMLHKTKVSLANTNLVE